MVATDPVCKTPNGRRDDLYHALAQGNVARLVERYGSDHRRRQTAGALISDAANEDAHANALPATEWDAPPSLQAPTEEADAPPPHPPPPAPDHHGAAANNTVVQLPTLREAVNWIPIDDLWSALRIALNQLTANQIYHQADARGGRPDFHLVDALFPIAHKLQLQQRILSYCVTFPLPATTRGSTECFVSVFVDLLVALGADMDFVYWWLLSRVAPPSASASCQSMECSLASFLEALEPLLPWGTALDPTTAERYDACLSVDKPAAIQAPASDVQRVAWHMIAELAAHGAYRPAVFLRAIARHPSSVTRAQHVVMWRQYLHAVHLLQSHANRRVDWTQHPTRTTSCGGGTLFAHGGGYLGLDDLGAMLAEPSPTTPPGDADAFDAAMLFDDGAMGAAAVDPISGLLVDVDAAHRTMLKELTIFNARVGLASLSTAATAVPRCTSATPHDDRFHIHDFHLMLVLGKVGLDATVGGYIVEQFVHWLPSTQKHQALLMLYDDVRRKAVPRLLELLRTDR